MLLTRSLTQTTGYDGKTVVVGGRVELHPSCDLWMMGSRYGDVASIWIEDGVPGVTVRVVLDRGTGHRRQWALFNHDLVRAL